MLDTNLFILRSRELGVVVEVVGLVVDDHFPVHEDVRVRANVLGVDSLVVLQDPRVQFRDRVNVVPLVHAFGFAVLEAFFRGRVFLPELVFLDFLVFVEVLFDHDQPVHWFAPHFELRPHHQVSAGNEHLFGKHV